MQIHSMGLTGATGLSGATGLTGVAALAEGRRAKPLVGVESTDDQSDSVAPAADPLAGAGTSALLSMAGMGTALLQTQQRQNNGTDVPAAVQNTLDTIAADPTYARQQAYELAHATRTVCTRGPGNDAPEAERIAWGKNMEQWQKTLDAVRQKKIALYDGETAKGTPADEVYAKLMKLEGSQSQEYWEALDPEQQMGDLQGYFDAQLSYLERKTGHVGTALG